MVPKTFRNMSLRTIIQESPVTLQRDVILNVFCWPEVGPILLLRGYVMHLNNRNADLNYVIVFCLKPVNVIRIMNTQSVTDISLVRYSLKGYTRLYIPARARGGCCMQIGIFFSLFFFFSHSSTRGVVPYVQLGKRLILS